MSRDACPMSHDLRCMSHDSHDSHCMSHDSHELRCMSHDLLFSRTTCLTMFLRKVE